MFHYERTAIKSNSHNTLPHTLRPPSVKNPHCISTYPDGVWSTLLAQWVTTPTPLLPQFHSRLHSPTCRSYLATADDRAPRATILQAESNNQLQFKINNNDSTNNNPRHTRSTGDKFNKQNKHQLSIRTLYQNINGVSATPREQIYTSKAANSNIKIWPVHDKTRKK